MWALSSVILRHFFKKNLLENTAKLIKVTCAQNMSAKKKKITGTSTKHIRVLE